MMKAGIIALFLGAGVLFLQELRAGEAALKLAPPPKRLTRRGVLTRGGRTRAARKLAPPPKRLTRRGVLTRGREGAGKRPPPEDKPRGGGGEAAGSAKACPTTKKADAARGADAGLGADARGLLLGGAAPTRRQTRWGSEEGAVRREE